MDHLEYPERALLQMRLKLWREVVEIELHELELHYEQLRIRSPARRGRLLASIAEHGQFEPVWVVSTKDRYTLIDGYSRVRALRELGRDVVVALLLDQDEARALVTTWRLETGGRRSALEDGWLIIELMDRHSWSQSEVAQRLQRSKSWVSRRRSLVESLPDSAREAVRMGRIPAHAAGKFLVPLARANASHCESIVDGLKDEHLSSRKVERLYQGYKSADLTGRQRIAEHPKLFVQATDALSRPNLDDGDPAKPLINDLDAISGCARRARRRLQEGLLHELDESRRQLVSKSRQEAELAFERLTKQLGCKL